MRDYTITFKGGLTMMVSHTVADVIRARLANNELGYYTTGESAGHVIMVINLNEILFIHVS